MSLERTDFITRLRKELMIMLVYCIRHGQTDWNLQRRLQGGSDTPLNEHGILTARLTGEQLQNIPFTKAISSPLCRAYETCKLILQDRPIEIETDENLKELSFGDYEGLCIYGEHKNIPDPQFQDTFFHHPESYITPPNGESLLELRKRARCFLHTLQNHLDWKDETVLVTAHGAILCAILAELHNYDMEHFWGKGLLGNCSVTILSIENGTITIQKENELLFHID